MKKIYLKRSWVIKAPRERVYEIMSDFENMPKNFPRVARSVKIINRDGNKLEIEAEARSFGRVFPVKMKTELRPPEGYVSDNISPIGRGHEEFLMAEVPEGTRINYTYDYEIRNPFFRFFAKILIGWYAMRFWEKAVIDKLRKMLEDK